MGRGERARRVLGVRGGDDGDERERGSESGDDGGVGDDRARGGGDVRERDDDVGDDGGVRGGVRGAGGGARGDGGEDVSGVVHEVYELAGAARRTHVLFTAAVPGCGDAHGRELLVVDRGA